MFSKIVAVFGIIAVASAADLTLGSEGGNLILEQNVTASPTIWKQVQNYTVNVTNSDEYISRIVVIDNRPEKDGEAKLVEGGAGHKNATIELKSPAVFRGFDFTVQVFSTQENVDSSSPSNPKTIGLDIQNPQVPSVKDITQETKNLNSEDVTLGAPKSTATTPAEIAKADGANEDKVNHPALAGTEQTRLNRDTKGQTTSQQPPIAIATDLLTKDIQSNKPVQKETDSDFDQVKAVVEATKDEVQPIIPLNGDEKQTTPKTDISSTTPKDINGPKVVPVTGEISSTTSAVKQTTEATNFADDVKTTQQLEYGIKGHHHHVPLPYINH